MTVASSGPRIGYRSPGMTPRGIYRCQNGLAAGTATANGTTIYEIVPVSGALRIRVRIKTATNGGTLDVFGLGPDFDLTQAQAGVAYGSLTGTIYSTGNPTQVVVAAGTESKADIDLYGEEYVVLKFSGTTGAGTITYVDVSQHADHP